jgi:hypothetical protein
MGRHDPTKARHGLVPGWTTVFTLRAGTTRPKSVLGFPSPNPFSTKNEGLGLDQPGPAQPGPAQFPALIITARTYISCGVWAGLRGDLSRP